MLGIGLGGFMQGFERGQQIRENMDAAKRRKVVQERQDKEYDRTVQQRDAIDAIGKEAQANFDGQVQSGAMSPEDFDSFWNKYTIPKLKQQYLLNGDIDNAEAVQKWGDSEDAREGGRLFTSSLLKAQTGDAAGALDDAMKLGKLKGYMSHGYEVLGQEGFTTQDGRSAYRIKLKTPDSKEVEQSLFAEDLPRLIATFGNPQSAMESQIAASNEKAKTDRELETYRKKKAIDKEFGLGGNAGGGGKLRADAITYLEKSMDGGLDGSETKFGDLARDQQEKLIQQRVELLSGQPGLQPEQWKPPERKVIVDTVTGKAVDSAPLRQPEVKKSHVAAAQTKSGQHPQAEQDPDRSWKDAFGDAARAVFGDPASRNAGADEERAKEKQGPADGRSAAQRSTSTMMTRAEAALREGYPVDRIEKGLISSGIPVEQWPASLREAIHMAKQNGIGLGAQR